VRSALHPAGLDRRVCRPHPGRGTAAPSLSDQCTDRCRTRRRRCLSSASLPGGASVTSASSPGSRVVVVIPAYNAERFLVTTAQSVLAQTLHELEVVIVDDGSSDDTLRLARSITDQRVTVLPLSNGGP